MKTISTWLISACIMLLLASCDHHFTSNTVVYPDGSLDKTFVLEQNEKNTRLLQLDSAKGWSITVTTPEQDTVSKSERRILTYRKHFGSVAEANEELAAPVDTLFQIESNFDKRFRWFYTYTRYSETYKAINRMRYPIDDYLTPEDYTFINRLPAEGTRIPRADSIRLESLNSVIFDVYGLTAYVEEHLEIAFRVMKQQNLDKRWTDSLGVHRASILNKVLKAKDVDDNFMLSTLDSLKFPLDYALAKKQYGELEKDLERRTSFITTAHSGTYMNTITMPGTIAFSNADSVAGSLAVWKPPVTRFLVNDYTMYAECRELNTWMVAATFILIGFTIFLFLRRK